MQRGGSQPRRRTDFLASEGRQRRKETTVNGKQRIGKRRGLVAAALGGGFLLTAGTALATPGVGVVGPVQARGTIGPTDGPNLVVNSKSGVHLKALGNTDLVTQHLTIAPGGNTGWHSHPGPVLVTVKAG